MRCDAYIGCVEIFGYICLESFFGISMNGAKFHFCMFLLLAAIGGTLHRISFLFFSFLFSFFGGGFSSEELQGKELVISCSCCSIVPKQRFPFRTSPASTFPSLGCKGLHFWFLSSLSNLGVPNHAVRCDFLYLFQVGRFTRASNPFPLHSTSRPSTSPLIL